MFNSGLFEGNGAKYFSYNVELLNSGKYRLSGQLVALSLKFDGPGMQCLHEAVYKMLTKQTVDRHEMKVDDISDGNLKRILLQVS